MTLNFWSFCLHILSAGITSVHDHTQHYILNFLIEKTDSFVYIFGTIPYWISLLYLNVSLFLCLDYVFILIFLYIYKISPKE